MGKPCLLSFPKFTIKIAESPKLKAKDDRCIFASYLSALSFSSLITLHFYEKIFLRGIW